MPRPLDGVSIRGQKGHILRVDGVLFKTFKMGTLSGSTYVADETMFQLNELPQTLIKLIRWLVDIDHDPLAASGSDDSMWQLKEQAPPLVGICGRQCDHGWQHVKPECREICGKASGHKA